MIQTIIVPTDGSNHARKAVELAGDLAGKYGARLVLLHVASAAQSPAAVRDLVDVARLPEPARAELERIEQIETAAASAASDEAGGLGVTPLPLPKELADAVGNLLLDDAEAAARAHGAREVNAVLTHGDPARSILALAEGEADLIVMGSRGLSDFAGLLLGSVSHKVSQLAPCTCITVK